MNVQGELEPIPEAVFVDGVEPGVHRHPVMPSGAGRHLPRFVALRAAEPSRMPGDGPYPQLVVYRREGDPDAYRVHRIYSTDQPTFTCPACGITSFHPKDVAEGYCGACHAFTRPARWVVLRRAGDVDPAAVAGWSVRLGWHDLHRLGDYRTRVEALLGSGVQAVATGLMLRARWPLDESGFVYAEVFDVRPV